MKRENNHGEGGHVCPSFLHRKHNRECTLRKRRKKRHRRNQSRRSVWEWKFALLAIALFDVSFFGKRIPTYLCVYLIGYYLVTADRIIKRIIKLKWFLVAGWIIASVVNILLFVYIEQYELLNTICNYLAFSFGIPALFCLAHEYLDFSNSVSQSASRLSYVFYSTHFPIAILCQYLISMTGVNCILNFIISLIIAYPVTIISCWLIDKLKFLRVIFGLK